MTRVPSKVEAGKTMQSNPLDGRASDQSRNRGGNGRLHVAEISPSQGPGRAQWTCSRSVWRCTKWPTGVLPFRGESTGVIFESILNQGRARPVRLNPDLPVDLERIVDKALEKALGLRDHKMPSWTRAPTCSGLS